MFAMLAGASMLALFAAVAVVLFAAAAFCAACHFWSAALSAAMAACNFAFAACRAAAAAFALAIMLALFMAAGLFILLAATALAWAFAAPCMAAGPIIGPLDRPIIVDDIPLVWAKPAPIPPPI